jgi:hypothetical protein
MDMDRPPPKIIKAFKRFVRAMESGKHIKSRKDMQMFVSLMNWLENQDRKHGGKKPCGEQPADKTFALSPEAKAMLEKLGQ